MDWPKAKKLIIAALLITDLVLVAFLLSPKIAEAKAGKKAAEDIAAYLTKLGAELECGLPADDRTLPVLFMSFSTAPSGETLPEGEDRTLSYRGIPVVVSGGASSGVPAIDSVGASEGDIRPSAYAAAELAGDLLLGGSGSLEGLKIESVSLVYWLFNSGADTTDTAFPCWCFETSEGSFYVSAFYE